MAATMSTHRTQVQWASGLNVLAAIWLFIRPSPSTHTVRWWRTTSSSVSSSASWL